MTPTQRTAALRLADYISADAWPGGLNAAKLDEAAALLRELALNDPCGYDETTGNCTQNPCCFLDNIAGREFALEPQSEPVAWMTNDFGMPLFVTHGAHDHPSSETVRPVYASPQPQQTEPSQDTPPQRQPLSADEEAVLARALKRAHGIGATK